MDNQDSDIQVGDRLEWIYPKASYTDSFRPGDIGEVTHVRDSHSVTLKSERTGKTSMGWNPRATDAWRRLPREPQAKGVSQRCPWVEPAGAAEPRRQCTRMGYNHEGPCEYEPQPVKVGDVVRDPKLLRPGMRIRKHYPSGRVVDLTLSKHEGGSFYDEHGAWSFDDDASIIVKDGITILALPVDSQKVTELRRQCLFTHGYGLDTIPCQLESGHVSPHNNDMYGITWVVNPAAPAKPEPKPSDPWAEHVRQERQIAAMMADQGIKAAQGRERDRLAAREWLRSGGRYEPGRNGMVSMTGGIWKLRG